VVGNDEVSPPAVAATDDRIKEPDEHDVEEEEELEEASSSLPCRFRAQCCTF
jgi:hypothetical protein